jgi:Arc/MetJ-type ribon-helix-helix transcriptional regulator
MSAVADNAADMAQKKTLKTFLADPVDFQLLSDSAELLSKAQGGTYSESDLIRRAVRAFVAEFALKEAPRLLRAQLAELPDDTMGRMQAERAREDVEQLTARLRETVRRVADHKPPRRGRPRKDGK